MGVTDFDDDSLLNNDNVVIKKEIIANSKTYVELDCDSSDSSEEIDIGIDLEDVPTPPEKVSILHF